MFIVGEKKGFNDKNIIQNFKEKKDVFQVYLLI